MSGKRLCDPRSGRLAPFDQKVNLDFLLCTLRHFNLIHFVKGPYGVRSKIVGLTKVTKSAVKLLSRSTQRLFVSNSIFNLLAQKTVPSCYPKVSRSPIKFMLRCVRETLA